MRYFAAAETDIGTTKKSNQDSLLIKHAESSEGEILMTVICDGMGGLQRGEVASAAVIEHFACWFDEELPEELWNIDMDVIGCKWEFMLKELNLKIMEYGRKSNVTLGTTFTGLLCIDDKYLIGHVGDTRLYQIDPGSSAVKQLTEDHTLVAREIREGKLSYEQAERDKRRNILLQCIGASGRVTPQIITGKLQGGTYLLCSDGFRHKINEEYFHENFNAGTIVSRETIHDKLHQAISTVKARGEQDNISAILVKAEEVI